MKPENAAEAERSLLGAVLAGYPDPDDLNVEPEDFYDPARADIWAAINRVHAAGNRPDPTSVRLALADRRPAIDPITLIDLTAHAIPANAPYYAENVTTAAGLRALGTAGIKVTQLGNESGDLDAAREDARAAIDAACNDGRTVSRARSIADMLPAAIDAAQHGATDVLPTGWPDIDRAIGGIAPGRFIAFAARPGEGKSLAGTNLALHVAHAHGHAALIASLEMPEGEVMNRILAAHAGVSLTHLVNGTVPESDWDKIAAKHDELAGLPLFVDDTSDLSVQGLRRIARDVQRQRDDLALIVVDYVQLMRPETRRRDTSRAEEVSTIARGLKLLARETGACVVGMAQVNREGGKNPGGPRLTDLREGGMENDLDAAILLHRPDPETPEVVANIAKNRHGPLATATLQMQGHYARLASTTWHPTKGMSA